MMRSPTFRRRGILVGVVIAVVSSASHCTSVIPPGPIRPSSLTLTDAEIAALDAAGAYDTVDADRYGRVIGEREDEVAGPPPYPSALGGPFQSPSGVAAPSRPTPGPAMKIDSMTETQLIAYLNSLVWDMSLDHSELALLPCKKAGSGLNCRPDSLSRAYIQPEVGMNRRPVDSIPPNGMVVARIINYSTSPDTESTFRLPPARRAWWYVDRDSIGRPRSRIFVRTYSGVGPAVTFVNTMPWRRCAHAYWHNRPAMARWRGCADTGGLASARSNAVDPRAFIRALSFAPRRAMAAEARPVIAAESWITCSLGCCVGA